jgi:hypothetical protein
MGFVLFFKSLLSGALTFLGKVWEWCCEHPKAAAAIVVLILSIAVSWHFGAQHQLAKDQTQIKALTVQIEKANAETKLRNERIAQLEKDSKTVADATQKKLDEKKKAMDDMAKNYEKKLAAERAKNRVIVLKDPVTNKDTKVEVNPAGEVVCSRVHDTTMELINDLVREANRP